MGRGNTILTEHEVQREFIKWFRQTFHGVRIFAIPNGGHRSKTQAMKLKAEGVSKGVPDLFCPALYLWIEMKREKGGIVAPEQRDWLEYLNEVGYTAIVARGLEDAKAQVIEHAQTFDFLRKVVG
jgi:phospholipid N-methyltransferase